MRACKNAMIKNVELLLLSSSFSSVIRINEKDNLDRTALFWACSSAIAMTAEEDAVEIVRLLLSNGANVREIVRFERWIPLKPPN